MEVEHVKVASYSPTHLGGFSAIREKGWSLKRNRKNIMTNARVTLDKEGNETRPDCAMASRVEIFQTMNSRDEGARNQNLKRVSSFTYGYAASQEAQRPSCGVLKPQGHRSAGHAIGRSVSFAYRKKETSSVLLEHKESCLSLSSSSERDLSNSLNGNLCRHTWTTGSVGKYSENKIPVTLRNKREIHHSAEGISSTDRIRRRSAEISQLRCALQEKVKAQQYRTYYQNTSYRKSWSDFPQTPEHSRIRSRPKSACGFLHTDDYFDTEREPLSSLEYRNNNRNMPRWGSPQQPSRVTSPPSFTSEERKLQYLMREPPTPPLSCQDRAGPYLCHKCSSPVRIRPEEYYWSTCGEDEDAPSRYVTPTTSPVHKASHCRTHCDNFKPGTSENDSPAKPVRTADGRVNYYPNCDPTIWIRSCTKEVIEPLTGVQIGEVPRWLCGALIRNGPGRIQVGEDQYNHVFDGSALLHRFHFKDGKVTYQNRFLQSRSYLRDTRAQRIVVNYFGTRAHPDPCKTILQNIASKFSLEEHFTDNAQISLYPYGDSLYALTETPFIFRIDPDTLATHEKVDLTRHIAIFTHTAHPHVDRDGTVYNLGQGAGPLGPKYHICKFPKTKTSSNGKVKTPFEQAKVVGTVAARWMLNPCYMHSFAMTDNYWVIIEQPLVVSVPKILKVLAKQDALIDALQWFEKETKIHVVRRDTGRVTTTQYVTETFFFLHTINAYEDRGHIVLDIAAYKDAEMLHCMFVEALKNAAYDPTYAQMFRGRPKRWVLPLQPDRDANQHTNLVTLPDSRCRGRWVKKGVVYVTPELLADIGCEVPRIYYEEYNGRHYQYFYAICSDVDHPKPGTSVSLRPSSSIHLTCPSPPQLVKVDVVNKQHYEWSEDNVYPSEPIFVPTPHGKREDDGVVLSALLRARGLDRQVCMLVLDASSFTELARVEFLAPGPVPKCLHGWFVPEGTLTVHRPEQTVQEDTDLLSS
ncbi:carotenoid isomerooxygenase-like isoform X1 [Portunus trituberculatus]|uniref:carotenoid isomerooxygenase-like isoform X1 n=1 Tax=Portunus trituberculatus TaxID=210409 RepID=UPI001E1CF8DD|nr:carotenoid isomerooxygenase-like isoform X1 [Portunus trituberculatus]XP_045135883.1 carotenoid isomerooxygenase-like isoform X1 [Portunus trituberculatus]